MDMESKLAKPRAESVRKAPRYRAVAEALRRQVDEGLLAAGVKLPALHELADQFKVSTHTVRCAIRVLEQEGCTYRVPAVGAFVRPGGAVASARQTVVALVTYDIGGAFELGIARGIEQACRDRGWELQIYDSRSDPQAEMQSLERLHQASSGFRGAIILPAGREESIESLFKLKLAGVPIVLLDRAIIGLRVDLVESEHEKGAYLATRHLLDRGHSHVYMLTEPPVVSSIVSRIRGYERAHRERGINPKQEWMVSVDLEMSVRGVREDHRWFGGYHAALPALRNLRPPIAFFAMNDYIAWGLCKACQELGLRVPQDVSVVCFDDCDITRAMTPPLTVVAQRTGTLGQKAVEMLERRVQAAGQDVAPQRVRVDVELIERQSVATLGGR
jgi:LacI family transcriptional regulator